MASRGTTTVTVCPALTAETWYAPTGAPPSLAGGSQDSETPPAVPLHASTTTSRGGPGGTTGSVAAGALASLGSLVPALFTATAVNTYSVSASRPVSVTDGLDRSLQNAKQTVIQGRQGKPKYTG